MLNMPDQSQAEQPELRKRRLSTAEQEITSRTSVRLPSDLLEASVRRLRIVALLYAIIFFLAAIFPQVLCQLLAQVNPRVVCVEGYFSFRSIGPPVVSILVGLVVYGIVRWSNLPAVSKLNLGLAFEVLGSVGIAVAEYHGVVSTIKYQGMETLAGSGGFGLSWVSVWVLFFTVLIPSPPRRALVAAVLSVSAVPIAFAAMASLGLITMELNPFWFFFALVFPYILVAAMAFVAAHIVYHLGTEVRRARELGSYRLVERLGAGGMGEVWRAEHRLLARPAAVKLVRPEALGTGTSERSRVLHRFEREAQATATMRCPHTVELYDFGVADDGTFYYVMELLDGFDLDTLVRQFGPLPAERAVRILLQVCHSLGEAHEAGLIHRDIKPANIYTCRFGRETDWVKVLDFGMVKHFGAAPLPEQKLTADNVVSGTPAYMAPEQIVGDTVDGRADLYALGCVAYWMLTGQQVFMGRTAMETMMLHVREAPLPPSQRTELPIPSELEAAVMACLAKEPGQRPANADALADRLRAVPLAQPWNSARAAVWWDAHRPRGAG